MTLPSKPETVGDFKIKYKLVFETFSKRRNDCKELKKEKSLDEEIVDIVIQLILMQLLHYCDEKTLLSSSRRAIFSSILH